MKRFILSYILFSFFVFSYAQQTIITDSLEIDESIRKIKETENGDFLFIKFSGEQKSSYLEIMQNVKCSVVLINNQLQEVNSATIKSGIGNIMILVEGIIRYNTNGILLHGNALDTITMDTQLCLIWMDTGLKIKKIKYYGDDNQQEIYFSYCTNDNGDLIFAGEYLFSSPHSKLVLTKIDSLGNFINIYHTNCITPFPKIVSLPYKQNYHVINIESIYQFDSEFNKVAFLKPLIFQSFFASGQPLRISDSSYIMTGYQYSPTPPYFIDISRVVINENAEYTNFSQIIKPETYDIPAQGDAVSSINTTLFFIGGTINSTGFPFETKNTTFALQKFDLEGNIYWENLYETGGNAVMMEVLALQDGGCLMAGQIWNWHQSNTEQRDLIFIKVNGDGIVTGIEDNEPTTTKINVYPNPGTNRLNISEHEDILRFTLYDFNGGKVLEYFSPPPTIDVSHLKRGFYFWRAGLNDGTMRSGKWIKR
jgi:hypothetical protein